jgi:dipeptidyl aminopeptidase/acylaminoacyl peptidase
VAAFLQRGKPDMPALINVHGYRSTRYSTAVLDRSDALNALGYTVVTPDLNDNGGATTGNGRISFGYSEKWDVLGAVDDLIARGFTVERIGLVGESMGAASALLAAAEDPRLRAVWADSSFARADVVLMEQAHTRGIPGFVVPGGLLVGALRSGDRVWEAAPLDVSRQLRSAGQAIYLLTCEKDDLVLPHHSRDLYQAYQRSGVDVTMWVVACRSHVGGLAAARDDYLTRLNQFFSQKLRPA